MLDEALAALSGQDRIAIDTEFVRERTYHAQLALVQLGRPEYIGLLDPLAGLDLTALLEVLMAPGCTKVLHAGRQDVEVLLPLTQSPLSPLLDTQIAAGLLGLPPQVGYADLVQRELGVTLEKGHARTDWTRRPLSAAQLEYAADDVRYLLPLADRLLERLEAAGRREWVAQDCMALTDPALYAARPEEAWQRLKGSEALPPLEQMTLRLLAAWRERRAIRRNLPRGWVLPDELLRELARRRPADPGQLRATGLLQEIAAAGEQDLGQIEQRADLRPTPEERQLADRLSATLKRVAAQVALSPEVLATQRDLKRLVRGQQDIPPLQGWRREIIGQALLDTVQKG